MSGEGNFIFLPEAPTRRGNPFLQHQPATGGDDDDHGDDDDDVDVDDDDKSSYAQIIFVSRTRTHCSGQQ